MRQGRRRRIGDRGELAVEESDEDGPAPTDPPLGATSTTTSSSTTGTTSTSTPASSLTSGDSSSASPSSFVPY